MEAMALKTLVEYSRGRPSRNASAAMAHTAFTGVRVCSLSARNTLDRGTPLSPAIARSTLDRHAVRRSARSACAVQAEKRTLLQQEHTLQAKADRAQQRTHLEFVDREIVVEQSIVTAGISMRMTPPVGLPYRACTASNTPSSLALLCSTCNDANLTLLPHA